MIQKTFYNKLVGSLTKNGKRQNAQRLLDQCLFQVSKHKYKGKKIKKSKVKKKLRPSSILYKLATKMGRFIELKKLKVRKNFILVPFPLKKNRSKFLVSSEIISILKTNTMKYDSATKLSEHMLSYLLKTGINYNKRHLYEKQILENRSNFHYRY